MQKFSNLIKGIKNTSAIYQNSLNRPILLRQFSQFQEKEPIKDVSKDVQDAMGEEEAEEHRKNTTKMFWLFVSKKHEKSR